MRKNPEFEELFDDDFEVTYEEYVPNEYRSSNDIYNDYDDDDDYYDDDYYDDDYEDEYYESDDENSDYDHTDPDDRTKKKKRRKNSKIPLAAPIRKGGRILSNISASLIRSLTALLILAVMIFASWTFLRASAPYGDIMEAVNTKTVPLSLAAYLSVALIFLLSEFIALLWSMTKVRVRDQWGVHKEDTGRGLNSFLLVFLTSYAAFWINRFLPETPDIIYGLKGGLEVYGSMHNVLCSGDHLLPDPQIPLKYSTAENSKRFFYIGRSIRIFTRSAERFFRFFLYPIPLYRLI